MEEIFGPNGLIARAHPEYEYRPGQIEMAEAVLRAFEERRHLIVEAETGTGKTLAYLVPAIAAATAQGMRVVISTGTKNLQEQLMEKDIPFLQRVLPRKFNAAYMKGRNNYLCLHRFKRAEAAPILEGFEDLNYFDEIRRWAKRTDTGDRGELANLPENFGFWRHLDARSEICLGQKCDDFNACFITRMRQRAQDADIIIVNHHLFFADLALRGDEYGQVIPDYGAVIFDEAHLIEDVASEYFGSQVSSYQIADLLNDLNMLPITDVELNRELTKIAARIGAMNERFWMGFQDERGDEGRLPLFAEAFARRSRNGEIEPTPLGEAYLALDGALERLETMLDAMPDPPPEVESMLRRVRQIRFDLSFIVEGSDRSYVYWLERRGAGAFLHASPIDVSGLLAEKLFERVKPIILTSATLTSGGSFGYIRQRLGLPKDADELIATSNFDYRRQAVLYLPSHLPDPRTPEWIEAAVEEICRLLRITEGHAFVLSTSVVSMNALYERVAARIPYPCLVQGSMSRSGILERFRQTPNAVLFATASFWQGVDVRGRQLSCVIIDKLPFAVPTDPVIAARQRAIDEEGGSSFYEYSVPQAVIALRQGLGRLIRSSTDRGILAILDPRLRTKPYGRIFWRSLPPMRVTSDLEEARRAFCFEDMTVG
jgi:ATP-dependent DNA helicase DinG